jgi:hypothetical protein
LTIGMPGRAVYMMRRALIRGQADPEGR